MDTSAECPESTAGYSCKATVTLERERFMERMRWHLEGHSVRYARIAFWREGLAVYYFKTEADRDLMLAALDPEKPA